jgi:hypothetical protein
VSWLFPDSSYDFFPDPINWNDIRTFSAEYLERRQHRFLQVDTLPYWKEYVPKQSGMLREAVWLHPLHRILYLAILQRLLPRLDSKIYPQVYSYRLDSPDDPKAYPFSNKMDRWKLFYNDFREAALDKETGALLLTDLANFFDHINCANVGRRLCNLLGSTADEADEEVTSFLVHLLNMWGDDGFGLPHNLDASSFLGSLYLHPVDHSMISQRYRYFRWIDDIRVVAKNKEQALRALHHLQRSLAEYRLFLATDKTYIIERSDPRFDNFLNVEEDILISEAEEIISSGDKTKIERTVDVLFERLQHHAGTDGDDRKFRAFANRLLGAGDYVEVEGNVHTRLNAFVIPRLKSHPEKSDYWTKVLSVNVEEDVVKAVEELLVDRPSMFDWQRFHLWKLALYIPKGRATPKLLERAGSVATSPLSDNVTSQAIVFLGKHGDNVERESIFVRLFTPQKGYVVQRAILIAIQELPKDTRNHFYARALQVSGEHKELVDYLANRDAADYGMRTRAKRHCLEVPRVPQRIISRGVGLARGRVTRFRLTRHDYDYE